MKTPTEIPIIVVIGEGGSKVRLAITELEILEQLVDGV
jgi:hypothetical protein